MKQIGLSMVRAAALIFVSSTTMRAQLPPRQQNAQMTQRAWDACNTAASRYGYRVLRRNQESVNGSQYQLPMHVSHGTTETDLTCSYDVNRGVAVVPRWDDRNSRVYSDNRDDRDDRGDRGERGERGERSERGDRRDRDDRYNNNGLSNAQLQAQQECQSAVNGRVGYRVQQVGTPVAHGARQWDVPLTVMRDNRRSQQAVTCRYNTANGKVTLR